MFLANEALTAALLGMVIGVPVLLVVFRTPPLRRWREERRFRSAMKRLGARVMRNVRLPDGMGGETAIDYLLLTTEAIRVVGVLRFPGLIFGGKRIDQWTQLINKRSYKFPNPDHYLQQQISAVRLIIPGAKVTGLHLFTDEAGFPRDKPPDVLRPADIRKLPRRPGLRAIPGDLRRAWGVLVDAAT